MNTTSNMPVVNIRVTHTSIHPIMGTQSGTRMRCRWSGRQPATGPYWPATALDDGKPLFTGPFDYDEFIRLDDPSPLIAIVEAAGKALGGSWSADLLETERGWFLTDMAEAHKSFHWEGCASRAAP